MIRAGEVPQELVDMLEKELNHDQFPPSMVLAHILTRWEEIRLGKVEVDCTVCNGKHLVSPRIARYF